MNYIWFDLETSGSSTSHDCILEAYFLLTNDSFQKLAPPLSVRCRLKEGVVPNLNALLINRSTVNLLKNSNMSWYQAINLIEATLRKWGPAIYWAYGGVNFDYEFLRKTWFKALKEPYLTNTGGSKQGDVLHVIRAAKLVKDDIIETPISAKGNPVFKLDKLMKHTDAHGAEADTIQTKKLAELIAKKANPVWKSSLMTTSRIDTEQLIQKEKSFCSLEYFYGKLRIYYTYYFGIQHPVYKPWFLTWDLQWDPADYIKMSREALKEALSKSPKVLRTIRCNKSPMILNSSYGMKVEPYSKISQEVYKKRMKNLDESSEFKERILNILQEKAEEKKKDDPQSLHPEDRLNNLYAHGFPQQPEKEKMAKFHSVDWKEKINLLDSFSQDHNNQFARRLVYEEAEHLLPKSIHTEIKRTLAEKILNPKNDEVNWTTVADFYSQIDLERNKSQKDPKRMKLLEEYNDFVMDIEKKYQNA